MRAMRNRVVHILWDTVHNDLPMLIALLKRLLN